MVTSGSKIQTADMTALFTLGNSNAAIARYYAANPTPPFVPYGTGTYTAAGVTSPNGWFTELCRLRSDMNAAAHWYKNGTSGDPLLALWEAVVSGPWPINGPCQSYDQQEFYYADRGQAEWVRLQSQISLVTCSKWSFARWEGLNGYHIDMETHTLIVGGRIAVKIEAEFYFYFQLLGADETKCHIDCLNWPAAWSMTKFFLHGAGLVECKCVINQFVDPGTYEVVFTADVGDGSGDGAFCDTSIYKGPASIYVVELGFTGRAWQTNSKGLAYCQSTASTATAGLHNSKSVKKIAAGWLSDGQPNYPSLVGITAYNSTNNGIYGIPPDYIQPAFGPSVNYFWPVGYTTSTTGLWTGKVPPVGSLNNIRPAIMPWNSYPPTQSWNNGGFSPNADTENSPTTPAWKAETLYPVGYTICDPCGFRWVCTVAGFSGMALKPAYAPYSPSTDWPTIDTLRTPKLVATVEHATLGMTYTEPGHHPGNGGALFFRAGPTWKLESFNFPNIPRWQPETTYHVGNQVIDAHGCAQQLVAVLDAAGNPTSDDSGTSGTAESYNATSMWTTTPGGFSTDPNAATFTYLKWQMLACYIPTFTPAAARTRVSQAWANIPADYYRNRTDWPVGALSMPRYPFIWFNDIAAGNVPLLYPAGTVPSSRWSIGFEPWTTGNPSFSHWIHRVFINRLGVVGAAGIAVKQAGEIAVDIGCMRNGAFVSFGLYQTGTMVEALWPIFTSDFLVYKADERVDLQATIIGVMNSRTDGSWGVDPIVPAFPICAHYVNDTVALLAKMV